ncbi:MAG TPA: alkaline phosphatase family protein [Actinomycetota bacterium]|nr:alkaline phosphatase family protein [Actinomycetota bacterium]
MRLVGFVLAALTTVATGMPTAGGGPGKPEGSRAGLASACGLPSRQLARIRAGFRPGRSGDVQFVPRPRNYVDERSHSGPWGYLQRVPLLFYGPGRVSATGTIRRRVTLRDVAPTLAAHLGVDPSRFGGGPLAEVPADGDPPRMVAVVVWDGGGRIVLREHPQTWPNLRRLRRRGVWFTRATVGSSPSVSPAVHASLTTGLPPARHGLVDMVLRRRGETVDVRDDPRLLLVPTLADVLDARLDNRPVAALVGHPLIVGFLGTGSAAGPDADRDIAVIEDDDGWGPPVGGAGLFRFPAYLHRTAGIDGGAIDPSARPRFADFQTETVGRLLRREGIGRDAVPDLLLVNYNQINEVGHHRGMHGPHMAAAVRSSDRALGDLVRLFDGRVGRGNWLLVLTADHGSTPDASATGSFRIDSEELARDLRGAFDRDGDGVSAIASIRVTQLWLRDAELAERGLDAEDVGRFLRDYTEAENHPDGDDEPVFSAAFPSDVLGSAPAMCRGGDTRE